MKFLIALFSIFLSINSAFASLDKEQVLKAISGQWKVRMDSGEVKFLVRNSGEISVISNAHRDYVNVQLSFNSSTSSWGGMDGLPVANIILSEGSDEDVRDVHFLVTALQYGDDVVKLKKLAVFSTFNDGPNEITDTESWSNFKKYDASSKKWFEVK